MKLLKLTSSNKCVKVDDLDYDLLNNFKWWLCGNNKCYYAYTTIENKTVLMHQFLLNSPSKLITIDHKDNDGLNNQRFNLRLATRQQQQQNRRKLIIGSSKYKGVRYRITKDSWIAQIETTINGKRVGTHLGYFRTEKAAAKAYNIAALQMFGEFAKLNEFNEPLHESELNNETKA